MRRAVALYRNPAYSPGRHLDNDRAILDAVVAEMAARGWDVRAVAERDIAAGVLPEADLYLNMCQGPEAALRLRELLPDGAPCINRPDAVLACHRHRLVSHLQSAGIALPRTILLATHGPDAEAPPAHLVTNDSHPVWVKRGDVHAQRPEDVVAVRIPELRSAISAFAARGIASVALQAHVPGPVVKFYGVIGRRFFHWYPADGNPTANLRLDAARLQDLAERAAFAVGLAVYGGDAALAAPDAPVLIDLNDWPSFAPVRHAAAAAIARYAHRRAGQYRSNLLRVESATEPTCGPHRLERHQRRPACSTP